MRSFTIFAFVLAASPAVAQEWNIRPWDGEMSREEVVDWVVGEEILFMDGGVARYGADGRYAYIYEGGRSFEGAYRIEDDGSICVDFDNGPKRCDLYVLHGERLVMIAETGRRFPVAY